MSEEKIKFTDLKLKNDVLEAIDAFGFEYATPIQSQVITPVLAGRDVVGCAQTGTGKTAAFLIPVVDRLLEKKHDAIRCLILAPTRELAIQIEQNLVGLIYNTNITCQSVYGGNQKDNFTEQKQSIRNKVDILVATPGRLIAHINLGYTDLSEIDFFILDEADRMMDMGFIGDIMKIHKLLPEKKQTLMFSATMAANIRKLAEKILHNPVQINLAVDKPAENINQLAFMVYDNHKISLLKYIIENSVITNMIVFASRKSDVDSITRELKREGIECAAMHSDKDQQERNELLRTFKAGQINILIATDILSRGIDIDSLSHVVNYDIPDDPADYVHRVGRTARAGKSGAAVSFINDADQFKFYNIEQLIERVLEKGETPSAIGESPTYDPSKRRSSGRGKHGSRKKGRNHRGKKGGYRGKNNERPRGSKSGSRRPNKKRD